MQPLRDRLLRYRVTLVPHSSGDRVDWLPPLDTPGVYRFPRPEAPSGVAELLADLEKIDAWGLDLDELADLYDAGLDDSELDEPAGPDRTSAARLADVVDLAAARARRAAGPAPATRARD